MHGIWKDSLWVMLFLGGSYATWCGFKNIPRIKKWRCTGEGIFAKSVHVCMPHRQNLASPFSDTESRVRGICFTAIYFLDEQAGRQREDSSCMVRDLHISIEVGERIRVFWDGQGEYRVEQ